MPIDSLVVAPTDGVVITVVDSFSEHGPTPEYANKVNYVQIKHAKGEISDLLHLARGSVRVKVGDRLKQGHPVAKTGLSGYMTAPHLHWMVWGHTDSAAGFISKVPRLNDSLALQG